MVIHCAIDVFGLICRLTPAEMDSAALAVIDFREAVLNITGSRLVPAATLEREAQTWVRHHPIMLDCRSGRQAIDAAMRLARIGFSDLVVLEDDIRSPGRMRDHLC
jgi:rhodanese-related sulfurtransferase